MTVASTQNEVQAPETQTGSGTETVEATGVATEVDSNAKNKHDIPRTVSQDHIEHLSKKAKQSASLTEINEESSSKPALLLSPFKGQNYTNLVSESTSSILFATDEWFARAENLLKDSKPVFDPDLYCAEGKVMDGWESRRRRTEGHDWCVIATESKAQGKINDVVGIEVDTAYFTGNQTPKISIEVANCYVEGEDVEEEEWMYTWMPGAVKRLLKGGGTQGTGQSPAHINKTKKACEKFEWNEILPVTELKPGYEESRMHYFMLDEERREMAKGFTHVRVNYFPDGGVARLRLWGSAESDLTSNVSIRESDGDANVIPSSLPYHHPELSLSTNGGVGLSCSNKHYGVPENLIRPTYGKDMSDGWETARHPDRPPVLIKNPVTNLIDNPLMDWAVLKLGMGGTVDGEGVSRIIIDTKHFKGNFPESVMVEGCNASCIQASDEDVCAATPEESISKIQWFPLLTRTKMGPDSEHVFHKEKGELMNSNCAVTHIRVSIYPDGGISRVRVYGQAAQG